MTPEQIIISIIRIAGSLPVLKWAYFGALFAIAVDFSDLFWMSVLDQGGIPDYQAFDKWLDLVYMLAFLYVSAGWNGNDKLISIALFVGRITGLLLFEITNLRIVLLYFPNIFEFWFLFVAGRKHFYPQYVMNLRATIIALVVCSILKLTQEFVLHGWKILDNYTFFEAIEIVYLFFAFWK